MSSESELLEHKTISDEIIDILRGEIQRGDLPPGTRLRQHEVAKRFGISTTPVREAFAQLQAEGLLQINRNRGAVVFRPTAKDLREAHEIRELLETYAIEKAVPRLTQQDISELEGMLREMRETEETDRWIELNHHFHLKLYAASGNDQLCNIIASLREASSAYIHMFAEITNRAERGDIEHTEILAACKEKDVKRAKEWTRRHVHNTVEAVLGVLNGESPNHDLSSAHD
jgi:DNA-binding GntR family transcriptional regulator